MKSEKATESKGDGSQALQAAIKRTEACGSVPELLATLADVFHVHVEEAEKHKSE